MTWATELKRIRYFLRDPNGSIWSENFLKHLYNDVQQDFQHKTNVLEDVVAQRVPATFQYAYLYDWEWRNLPADESLFHQALTIHDDYTICHRWEAQQIAGIATDVADYGIHFTQSWEAFTSETPGELAKMAFPNNLDVVKFIAYDRQPLLSMTKKQIQSTDPSYLTKDGLPIAYFPYDDVGNKYVLYPRPSTSFVNEAQGDGVAFYADGDTEDVTTGTIAVRAGSVDSAEIGAAVDIVDDQSSVFMVYEVSPTDVSSGADEPDFPIFLRKYIRYGVISRAYGGNNDGRIKSLADYWGMRYNLGVEYGKKFKRNRHTDRDYRLVTGRTPSQRTRRHPRLPDHYPAVNP